MTASSLRGDEGGLQRNPMTPEQAFLPAVVIYGANASGKSNVILAMRFMQTSVLFSQSMGRPQGGVPRSPFALDLDSEQQPSVFTIDFAQGDLRYHYGFECSDEGFISEWLYSFPNNKQTRMFVRKGKDFEFGRALRGRNRTIADLTRPNSLFVSAGFQNNHPGLQDVFQFFVSMQFDREIAAASLEQDAMTADGKIDSRTIEFLRRLGTGIVDHRVREEELSDEAKVISKAFMETLKSQNLGEMAPTFDVEKNKSIELGHMSVANETRYFRLARESSGTRRLLNMLGRCFNALDKGSLVVIDEMDASLHTKASEAIITLFNNKEINKLGAQLIATTHDTNLLSSPLLRRDQIWFTEKDDIGASDLYPLSDIATRAGDNIEKGYLQGKYGAVPFSGSAESLFDESL